MRSPVTATVIASSTISPMVSAKRQRCRQAAAQAKAKPSTGKQVLTMKVPGTVSPNGPVRRLAS